MRLRCSPLRRRARGSSLALPSQHSLSACFQVPALEVLLYSLKKSGTSHPLVVLALPGVTAAARDEIGKLADQVRPVDQLAYPFEGLVKFEVGINKQCRYSKLHLWGQTDFDRVVYLDADTAVQKVCLPLASFARLAQVKLNERCGCSSRRISTIYLL